MTRRPLFVASFGAFVAGLSTSLVAVSAPVIARDLAVTKEDVSWVLTAYLLAITCLLALAGKAADVLGRKRVYLTGFCFFVAGSAMCAGAPLLRALVGARVMQGCGAAMLMAVGPAIVTRAVPPARRARALGTQLALTYVGLVLGPSIGGFLAARLGWQAVFLVIAGAGALGGVLALALLEPDDGGAGAGAAAERPSWRSLDLGGAVLFAAGFAALLVALHRVRSEGWSSAPVLAILAFVVVALGAFVRHEALAAQPLLPLRLLRQPPFAFGVLGATLLYTVTFMLSSWLLPFQLQRAGLGPAEAGGYLTAQPIVMAFVAPVSGWIADRWGPRLPSAGGMLLIAAGMLAVARAAEEQGPALVVSLALVGVGAGLYVAPNSALIMGAAPKDRQSIAAAMAATARNLGMTLGVALGASLDRAFGFRAALVVAACLGACGALLGVVRPVVASPR
ncbi:MAG: MFS transporter [Labilithrix sp.]|nr:MFS transporter [Labilithrix sp.]MCW5817751.1 MFS transporter [Labilithrix sp.]